MNSDRRRSIPILLSTTHSATLDTTCSTCESDGIKSLTASLASVALTQALLVTADSIDYGRVGFVALGAIFGYSVTPRKRDRGINVFI